MSQKACDKVQAMQQEEPSLAIRVSQALEELVGEPVEFFMAFFVRDDKGRVLVSTAGMMEEDIVKQAPLLVVQALAKHAAGDGYSRVRKHDDTKH